MEKQPPKEAAALEKQTASTVELGDHHQSLSRRRLSTFPSRKRRPRRLSQLHRHRAAAVDLGHFPLPLLRQPMPSRRRSCQLELMVSLEALVVVDSPPLSLSFQELPPGLCLVHSNQRPRFLHLQLFITEETNNITNGGSLLLLPSVGNSLRFTTAASSSSHQILRRSSAESRYLTFATPRRLGRGGDCIARRR